MVTLAGKAIAFRYSVSLLAPFRVIVPLAGKAIAFCNKVSLLAPPRVMVPEMVPVADCLPAL